MSVDSQEVRELHSKINKLQEKQELLLELVDDMKTHIENNCGFMATGIFPNEIDDVINKVISQDEAIV